MNQNTKIKLIQNQISITLNNRCYTDGKGFYVSTLKPHFENRNEIFTIHFFNFNHENTFQGDLVQLRHQLNMFDGQQYNNLMLGQKKNAKSQMSGLELRSGKLKYTMFFRQQLQRKNLPQQIYRGTTVIYWQNNVIVKEIRHQYALFHKNKNFLLYSQDNAVNWIDLKKNTGYHKQFKQRVERITYVNDIILIQIKDKIIKIGDDITIMKYERKLHQRHN